MDTKNALLKELFQFEVRIKGDVATWENNKHPENPDFQQVVFWMAYVANNKLVVRYYLDKTNISRSKIQSVSLMGDKSFEEAVFEYWKNN